MSDIDIRDVIKYSFLFVGALDEYKNIQFD